MAASAQRDQRIARVIDREVAPVWHDRFARLMFRELPAQENPVVLDVHCGTGRTTREILTRLGDDARVVAIDPNEANLTLARSYTQSQWREQVYFKAADVSAVAGMGDDSYDLTLANLVLAEAHDWPSVIAELCRVTKPGGQVLATMPLRGTWAEVEDLFYEVLLHEGLTDAVRRLSKLARMRPTGKVLAEGLRKAGIADENFVVEQERFSMLFPSGREFLFAPSIEHGPLRLWKAIIGKESKPQELFWRLKEAIDVYFTDQVFSSTIVAGLIRIEVPGGTQAEALATRYWRRFPEIDAIFRGDAPATAPEVTASDDEDLDMDLDIDIDMDDGDDDADEQEELPTGNFIEAMESGHEPEPTPEMDSEMIAALAEATDEDEDIESMLDEVFELDDEEVRPESAAPQPVERTNTAARLGLKIGSRPPPPPPKRKP